MQNEKQPFILLAGRPSGTILFTFCGVPSFVCQPRKMCSKSKSASSTAMGMLKNANLCIKERPLEFLLSRFQDFRKQL
jgi:hypothetical protein